MQKTTNFIAIILCSILLSCQQSATNADATNSSATDTTATTTNTETPKAPTKLELIDIENNKIIAEAGEDLNKAVISEGSIFLYQDDNNKSHRFFGYEKPDVNSKRLLAASSFTNDVEGNPFACELGAYYDLEGVDIKYLETSGGFVKAEATANGTKKVVFFESKWITSEK